MSAISCPGGDSMGDENKRMRFPNPKPGTKQFMARGRAIGEERKETGREEERIWEGGRGKKKRMEEGRKETLEEVGEGKVGGQGQREQGSLTGGHSGQGDM